MERLLAFIDEAGQRPATVRSSRHFVMSAVTFPERNQKEAVALLAQLRVDLDRRPIDTLHWRNYTGHALRLRASQALGLARWATVSSVVVAKPFITDPEWTTSGDVVYLHTLRYLLERLSWMARDQDAALDYTLSHVVHFPIAKLRQYERNLRTLPDCTIAWNHVPNGGNIDQPLRVEELQLADIAASATFAAFEPDRFGNTEPRYLQSFADRLYRGRSGRLASYGLKMVPWSEPCRAAYPFVQTL